MGMIYGYSYSDFSITSNQETVKDDSGMLEKEALYDICRIYWATVTKAIYLLQIMAVSNMKTEHLNNSALFQLTIVPQQKFYITTHQITHSR